MDLLMDDQRLALLTRELGDRDLAERLIGARRALVRPVPDHVARAQIADLLAATSAAQPTAGTTIRPCRQQHEVARLTTRPALASFARTTARLAAAATVVAFATAGGLAAAGVLPAAAQNLVAEAASHVGVDLPRATVSTAAVPVRERPSRAGEIPGNGGVVPGAERRDPAPGAERRGHAPAPGSRGLRRADDLPIPAPAPGARAPGRQPGADRPTAPRGAERGSANRAGEPETRAPGGPERDAPSPAEPDPDRRPAPDPGESTRPRPDPAPASQAPVSSDAPAREENPGSTRRHGRAGQADEPPPDAPADR
jgi:hypothetical protein